MSAKGKFCILPWVHAHVLPNGDVLPCCAVQVGSLSLGNVHQKELAQIWNDEGFREIRRKMMAGEKVSACEVCYLAEAAGGTSLRTKSNNDFSRHKDLLHKTKSDGTLSEFKLRYYDVRFSNLCNLKCRMCCPELSSAIDQDQARMQNLPRPKPLDVYADKGTFLRDFVPHIPYLEEIYFAGGEPLLIDAHYWALEELLRQKKTDIRLRYNTNFTILGKAQWHAPHFWKHFKAIEIGASLDAEGSRGEYIREGTRWDRVLANREIIRQEVPHADFKMAITVGLLNLLHVPDFIQKSIESGFIKADGFFTNNLLYPQYLSAQVLPEEMKEIARRKYADLIPWLKKRGSPEWILMNLSSIVPNMNSADRTDLLPTLLRETKRLDVFYAKNVKEVFPEYHSLFEDL